MLYCGIDIAKRKHAVVVLDEHGQTRKPVFTIENTHAGFAFLEEELKQLGEDVLIGLEAAGHYWLAQVTDSADLRQMAISSRPSTHQNLQYRLK